MAMVSAVCLAQAQSTKAVRIVVPFASSGVQDALARALSQEMGVALGQTVIVENRPGAGGTVGTGYVARAEADGTVILARWPLPRTAACVCWV
jgi:tripartite-type tricarboxylate transporter receptor subunit TctC